MVSYIDRDDKIEDIILFSLLLIVRLHHVWMVALLAIIIIAQILIQLLFVMEGIMMASHIVSCIISSLQPITINYNTYYECAIKTDAWIEWYQKQKHIFESVK
jgi:hypothetical protein